MSQFVSYIIGIYFRALMKSVRVDVFTEDDVIPSRTSLSVELGCKTRRAIAHVLTTHQTFAATDGLHIIFLYQHIYQFVFCLPRWLFSNLFYYYFFLPTNYQSLQLYFLN